MMDLGRFRKEVITKRLVGTNKIFSRKEYTLQYIL